MAEEKNNTFNLIVGIATVIGAIAIVAKLFSKDSDDKNDDKAERSKEDLYKKIKPSYPDHTYLEWGKQLNTALMLNSTEDENKVYKIFGRFKNVSDYLKTVEFFGTRRKLFTTQYITLPEAIDEYFSDSEKHKLNQILNQKRIGVSF
jgi:hypothetical protein